MILMNIKDIYNDNDNDKNDIHNIIEANKDKLDELIINLLVNKNYNFLVKLSIHAQIQNFGVYIERNKILASELYTLYYSLHKKFGSGSIISKTKFWTKLELKNFIKRRTSIKTNGITVFNVSIYDITYN